jgi:quinol monooxygenase YgiN
VLVLIVTLRARGGAADELWRELQLAQHRGVCDPGNVGYEALRSADDPDIFVLLEKWVDQRALDAHTATSHVRKQMPRLQNLVAEPITARGFVSDAT